MSSTRVYVVEGTERRNRSADCSIRPVWIIAAYTREALARDHVEEATKEAKRLGVLYGDVPVNEGYRRLYMKWDSRGLANFTGLEYSYREINLYDSLMKGRTP